MSGVRGQGRKFDIEQALDVAMDQFWRHGYEGTSIASLTEAMGISPPSLYSAFGGKEQLFYRVVDHYLHGPGAWMALAFDEEESPSRLVRRMLHDAATNYADPALPGGCMMLSLGSLADTNEAVAVKLREHRNENVARLAQRLTEGQRDGEIPADLDTTTAADFVGVTVQGMAVRARDGATVDELVSVARFACAALGFDADRPAAGREPAAV